MADFCEITDKVWSNKLTKGFNTESVEKEFNLLYGEVAEAYDAWRKGRDDVGEELADVMIFLLSLARMTGVDLEAEIEMKMIKNGLREYRQIDGCLQKVEENEEE